MHINWGNCKLDFYFSQTRVATNLLFTSSAPPLTYTVLAGSSIDNMTTVVSAAPIEISAPYDAASANAVSIKIGNLTDVKLNSTITARYVNLTIEGSRDGETSGGTVAEFAVL